MFSVYGQNICQPINANMMGIHNKRGWLIAVLASGVACAGLGFLACSGPHLPVLLPMPEAAPGAECVGQIGVLRVSSDAVAVGVPPWEGHLVAEGKSTKRFEFSFGWAEKRIVEIERTGGSAQVVVHFETDYGDFSGEVETAASKIWTCMGTLCFELSIVRLDGSKAHEKWAGRMLL